MTDELKGPRPEIGSVWEPIGFPRNGGGGVVLGNTINSTVTIEGFDEHDLMGVVVIDAFGRKHTWPLAYLFGSCRPLLSPKEHDLFGALLVRFEACAYYGIGMHLHKNDLDVLLAQLRFDP